MMLYGCFPFNLAKITAPRAPTDFRGQRMKSCLEWRVVCGGGSLRTLASPHARALPLHSPWTTMHWAHEPSHSPTPLPPVYSLLSYSTLYINNISPLSPLAK